MAEKKLHELKKRRLEIAERIKREKEAAQKREWSKKSEIEEAKRREEEARLVIDIFNKNNFCFKLILRLVWKVIKIGH